MKYNRKNICIGKKLVYNISYASFLFAMVCKNLSMSLFSWGSKIERIKVLRLHSLNLIKIKLVREKQGEPATKTIASYVGVLKESYMLYDVKRFDIKGKEYLKTLGKYYVVDIGLRNYLLGFRDRRHALENIVYFELLRRGFDVSIGKINNLEVDFIATKCKWKNVYSSNWKYEKWICKRELKPLQNNHKKIVITLDKAIDDEYDEIESIDIIEWLLK